MHGRYEHISNSELSKAIDEWISGRMAYRNRRILKDKLIEGMTYEAIAEKYELSVRHVKTIVYQCEYRLYRHT